MGRLRVSEDVLQCLLVSLVSGVVFGVIGGVFWFYLGSNEKKGLSCLEVVGAFSDSSAHVIFIQARANPPFWPNSERQDFFT